MDREGFSLIDRQYQEELAEAKRKVTEEIKQQYSKYESNIVGTPQMRADARAKLQKDMQRDIKNRMTTYEARINDFHFKEYGGRDAAMKQADQELETGKAAQQEVQTSIEKKKAAYEERLSNYYNEKAKEQEQQNDLGRSH